MNIKEIALKVRATTHVSHDPDKYVEDLFTNFVAEIQRQSEPLDREKLFGLVAELKGGSNWLSGRHNVYSYNRSPKIAADVLSALGGMSLAELVGKLRNADQWKREGFGHYKDVTMEQNDAPFRAADLLEQSLFTFPPDKAQIEQETAWQPIETAPKDGSHLLCKSWNDTEPPTVCHWFDGDWHLSVNRNGNDSEFQAAFWMPLPKPPAIDAAMKGEQG